MYEKDDSEKLDSMVFIDHSKNVDIKKQKAIDFKETYEFDIPPGRIRVN